MKLEIYDAGIYTELPFSSIEEAKTEMLNRGNKAHEKLLEKNTPEVRVVMTRNEYAIIGKHQNLWFSARVIE